jgi:hypothetical protein
MADEIAPPKEVTQAQDKVKKLKLDRDDIDRKIAEASVLVQAWENFNLTLQGKFKAPAAAATAETKTRKPSGPRAKTGALPDLQQKIVAVVERYLPDGAKAASIYEELGVREDTKRKPIDAALIRMKKSGLLYQSARKQPYTLGPNAPLAQTTAVAATTPREKAPALADADAAPDDEART